MIQRHLSLVTILCSNITAITLLLNAGCVNYASAVPHIAITGKVVDEAGQPLAQVKIGVQDMSDSWRCVS